MSKHTINFDIAEPVVSEEWDGVQSYVTKVAYPHRTWTIHTIQSGYWAGDYWVASDDGKDLGEFHTFDSAMSAIKDRETP